MLHHLDYREIGGLLRSRGPWRYAEGMRIVSGTCTCIPECSIFEIEIGLTSGSLRQCESRRLAEMFPELCCHPEGYERVRAGTDG